MAAQQNSSVCWGQRQTDEPLEQRKEEASGCGSTIIPFRVSSTLCPQAAVLGFLWGKREELNYNLIYSHHHVTFRGGIYPSSDFTALLLLIYCHSYQLRDRIYIRYELLIRFIVLFIVVLRFALCPSVLLSSLRSFLCSFAYVVLICSCCKTSFPLWDDE